MSDVVERIDLLLAKRDENRVDMSLVIGIAPQTVSGWSTKDRIPRADDLYKIAKYLNVSMGYLLTGKDKNMNYEENELLRKFSALSDEQKAIVLNQIDFCYKQTLQAQKENSI